MTVVKAGQVIVLKRPGEKPERVRLGSELKSGGAGAVHSIKDDSIRVIKIYNDETLAKEGKTYQEKIECMLANVPKVAETASSDKGFVQLAWPLASAYTIRGKFAGFAMPMVDMQQTAELEFILSPKQAEKEGLQHHFGDRLHLAHNLAAVVSSIHALGHAIVDLKPVNLKFFKKEWYVAVLDCDGFYINVPGKTASAPQVTLDYLAPEFHDVLITIPEHQDRFALAVIIFQLLNFSIHPYACVPKNNAQIPSDTEGKIKLNLYSYGIVPHKKVSPKPGSAHEAIPVELRMLFDLAFGGAPSSRPTALEWAAALRKFAIPSAGLLSRCKNQHIYFKGMPCATCLREQVIKNASVATKPLRQQGATHILAAPSPAPRAVNIQPSARQAQTNPLPPQPSVRKVGVKPSFSQKIPRIPKVEIFLVTMFILSIAGFIADSDWIFWPSAILLVIPLFRGSGMEIKEILVGSVVLALIWYVILAGIKYVVQHYWEFILIFVAVSFVASALIYLILGKLTSPAKQRIGKSAFGGFTLAALLFGGFGTWGPSFADLKGEWVLFFNNSAQEKSNYFENQPIPTNVQQVATEQELPQPTNSPFVTVPPPVAAPVTITYAPEVQEIPIVQDTPRKPLYLGMLVRQDERGRVIVTAVENGGPAFLGGIRVGDELVAMGGNPVNAESIDTQMKNYNEQHGLTKVIVWRGGSMGFGRKYFALLPLSIDEDEWAKRNNLMRESDRLYDAPIYGNSAAADSPALAGIDRGGAMTATSKIYAASDIKNESSSNQLIPDQRNTEAHDAEPVANVPAVQIQSQEKSRSTDEGAGRRDSTIERDATIKDKLIPEQQGISAADKGSVMGNTQRGWFGITVQPLTKEFIHSVGLAFGQGIQIKTVAKDGPAAQAGMSVGDILISVDGKIVGVENVVEVISGLPIGKTVPVEVIRTDARKNLLVKVGQKP